MKRALFFVHYNKHNLLEEYVLYLLKNIKPLYSKVIFISNSPLKLKDEKKLSRFQDSIIYRQNAGFDFGAWRDALLQEGWTALAEYGSITLMNDTCFGPLFDMEDAYKKMEESEVDFWGMTYYEATPAGMPWTNGAIPGHLQSYFLCFNNKVIVSKIFRDFWQSVQDESHVWDVIVKYETQLTALLLNAGFTMKSVLNRKQFCIVGGYPNPEICVLYKVPLLKIKALDFNEDPWHIIKLVETNSIYPAAIIKNYFFRRHFKLYIKSILEILKLLVKILLPASVWAVLKSIKKRFLGEKADHAV